MELLQISLTTNDPERLKAFYINVFGFLPYSVWSKPEASLKAVKLIRNEVLLEITESTNLIPVVTPFSLHKQGFNMLGFIVDSVPETIEQVVKYGGKLDQPITAGVTVKEIAYVLDPDGNGIELIKPHTAKPQKPDIKIADYDRSALWATGQITPDLQIIGKYIATGLWKYEPDETEINKAIQKAGDICGCPIPDKVASREGEIFAFNYLTGLSNLYNEINSVLLDLDSPLLQEWGKVETRNTTTEPAGEDASRIPESILKNNILRGTGKYQEFAITRLLWIDQQETRMTKKLGFNAIKQLLANAKSLDEFQTDLIITMADKRFEKEDIKDLVSILLKGIAHEGFFKQNNPYDQVSRIYKLLQTKSANKEWFKPLSEEVERVLSQPKTEFS